MGREVRTKWISVEFDATKGVHRFYTQVEFGLDHRMCRDASRTDQFRPLYSQSRIHSAGISMPKPGASDGTM